jgi:hypothetical protein
MAIAQRLPVSMGVVFPHGAFVVGAVSAVDNFDRKKAGEADPQERDKESGLRLWAVRVVDADPESRRGQAEVVVKVAAEVQPVPPDLSPVTPYVDDSRQGRPRVAYSFRATGMRAPEKGVRPVPAGRGDEKAA